MTLTLQQLLTKALSLINASASVSNDELEDARISLNLMLAEWASPPNNLTVQALTYSSKTLTPATASYTIGASGGDWTAARPTDILNAYMRDSGNYDYPMTRMGILEYHDIVDKTSTGRPDYWIYDPYSYTLGRIYLFPTPDAAETLHIDYLAPFTDLTTMASTVTVANDVLNAIRWNLALELAPEYEHQPSPVLVQKAQSSFSDLKDATAANRVRPIYPEFSEAGTRRTRNILTGF
jgi:hypothetical protein